MMAIVRHSNEHWRNSDLGILYLFLLIPAVIGQLVLTRWLKERTVFTERDWLFVIGHPREKVFSLHNLIVMVFTTSFSAAIKEQSFALKSRMPSMYDNREAADAGGLMSYGADFADSYRRVAYFVDRILKGAKPADLPVEQPTKFELVINLKTAKQIGLTIPQSMLYRADKVIK
jgi:hypothetical protein